MWKFNDPPSRIHLQKMVALVVLLLLSLRIFPLIQIRLLNYPQWVFCHPKPNLIVCQYIHIWGKSIRLENFLKVSQKFLL